MSRDSSATYIHTHASHHADLFEEFCHPPSSGAHGAPTANGGGGNNNTNNASGAAATGTNEPGMIQVPGHFLPFEEIQLPPHLMPVNPEDEDDVVPDMHAAFGIQRALGAHQGTGAHGTSGEGTGRGAQQEPIWRDLGLARLLDDSTSTAATAMSGVSAARREGKKTGLLLMR